MKKLNLRWLGLLILCLRVSAYSQSPPLPPNQFFYFLTNFLTASDNTPLAYSTNLLSIPVSSDFDPACLLVLDTTNLSSASLSYNVRDTNPFPAVNINYSQGTLLFYYVPNWASVSHGGTGPGATAYLISGGDWSAGSSNGLFQFYVDAAGSNLVFAGVKAGVTNIFARTPISWPSNAFHQIGLEWQAGSDCEIYLDGTLAVSGGSPTGLPSRSTWTNGFFVLSDDAGYEQGRGGMFVLTTWGQECGGFYTNGWLYESNQLATWQSGFGGAGFFGMFMSPITGMLTPDGVCTNCITGTGVMFTNMLAMRDTNGDGGTTFVFSVTDGTNGMTYDVLATTALWTNNMTNSVWTWLGQATNGGTYAVTNQPTSRQFCVLGGTLDSATGLTLAYENLVSHGVTQDAYGTPYLWYLRQGLNPLTGGIATQDPDGDGLLNYQEYLYGTRPLVSEGVAVWVSEPSGISGIP